MTREERTLSGDANLSGMSVGAGTLEPAFDPDVTSYAVTVPYETENVEITAEAGDGAATVDGAGRYTLELGANDIRVTVTAESGTERVYQVNVWRGPLSIEDIRITNPPVKISYFDGEALDLSGMVVTATYGDGYSRVLGAGEYTVSPAGGTALTYDGVSEFQSVTVKHTYIDTVKTAEFGIIVKGALPEFVEVGIRPSPLLIADYDGEVHCYFYSLPLSKYDYLSVESPSYITVRRITSRTPS